MVVLPGGSGGISGRGGVAVVNTVTIWVILMMLSITLNVLSIWLGVEEMRELSKLTNKLVFVVLAVKYISIGLYLIVKRRKVDTRW